MAFLFSKIDRNRNAFYTTMVSLTPNIAYELVQKKRLSIAPFVSQHATWLITKGGDRSYYDNISYNYETTIRIEQLNAN